MDDSNDEITAYHEAGHAWMALTLRGHVESVSIAPDNDDGPARYGDTLVAWPRDMSDEETQRRSVLVCLAGPVAEMIHRQEPLHPGFVTEWADDWRQAWQLAAEIQPVDRLRLKYLEGLTREVYQHLSRDDVWSRLCRIVDHLLAYEQMDADELREWL